MKQVPSPLFLAIILCITNIHASDSSDNLLTFNQDKDTFEKQRSMIDKAATAKILSLATTANNSTNDLEKTLLRNSAQAIYTQAYEQYLILHASYHNHQKNKFHHNNSSSSLSSQQTQEDSWKQGFQMDLDNDALTPTNSTNSSYKK